MSSSAASSANNFENQNTFQIVSGAGGAGAGGVGVLSGVVTGVTGGGATGISEGQAVSISLISQVCFSSSNISRSEVFTLSISVFRIRARREIKDQRRRKRRRRTLLDSETVWQ